jgi:hypothetical protein
VKALWELFLRSLKEPLRRSFLIVAALLPLQAQATKMILQLDYRDVLLGSYFLTSLTVAGIYLAIQCFRHSARPWSYLSFTGLIAIAGMTGFFAWQAWQYVYDPEGFYVQRRWHVERRSGSTQTLSLKVIAALNSPIRMTFRVEVHPKICSAVAITDLHPIVPLTLDVKGEETLVQSKTTRQFTFDDFQRPAEITFHLSLANIPPVVSTDRCFSGYIRVGGKSSEGNEKPDEKKDKEE